MATRSVSVIVEDPRGRLLLLRRGPTDPWMPGRWNLPGGKIDPGESPTEAATREVWEEAHLRVYALSLVTRVVVGTHTIDVFWADHWSGRVRMLDGEHSRSAWVPREIAWTWDLVPAQREVLRDLVAH